MIKPIENHRNIFQGSFSSIFSEPTWKISVKFDNFPQVGVKINIWVPTTEKISVSPVSKNNDTITKKSHLEAILSQAPIGFLGQLLNHPEKQIRCISARWSFFGKAFLLQQFYLIEPIFVLRGEVHPGPYVNVWSKENMRNAVNENDNFWSKSGCWFRKWWRTSSSGLKTGFEAVKQSLILKGSWLIVE